ncbi:MAG: hypothetical protein EOP70_14210 [Variovorax sp.]|nr:MAG: hypothetical protein EOP70_14210 [Variovorax sp.]
MLRAVAGMGSAASWAAALQTAVSEIVTFCAASVVTGKACRSPVQLWVSNDPWKARSFFVSRCPVMALPAMLRATC